MMSQIFLTYYLTKMYFSHVYSHTMRFYCQLGEKHVRNNVTSGIFTENSPKFIVFSINILKLGKYFMLVVM